MTGPSVRDREQIQLPWNIVLPGSGMRVHSDAASASDSALASKTGSGGLGWGVWLQLFRGHSNAGSCAPPGRRQSSLSASAAPRGQRGLRWDRRLEETISKANRS